MRGATVAAQRLQPDAAIVLEGTYAYDVPDPNREADAGDLPSNPGTRMGEGAVITLSDRQMITDPRALRFLRETAAAHGITHQVKTMGGAAPMAAPFTWRRQVSRPCRSRCPAATSIRRRRC